MAYIDGPSLARKTTAAGVIRHGFYRTKRGKRRRYRCRECGQTFCSNTGTGTVRLTAREWHGTRLAGRKLLILGLTTGYFWHDIAVISLNLTVPAWLMISGGKRCLR